MSAHRVSVLNATLRRHEDPTKSKDPRVRALLEQLRNEQIAAEPRLHFRAELRAQLVAVAPRIVAESRADGPPAAADSAAPPAVVRAPEAAHRAPDGTEAEPTAARRRLRAFPVLRPLAVAATVLTVFALLLGGAVWMSQKALPGDTLYGLKRASEKVTLALDTNDTERAQDHLSFAGTRVEEARQLLSRPSAAGAGALADGQVSARTSQLIYSALGSADSDTRAASRLLGEEALQSGSAKPLTDMVSWVPTQLRRLQGLASAMPAGALRARTAKSTDLVDAVAERASMLATRVDCRCGATTGSDSLGPVPCLNCSTSRTSPAAPAPTSAQPAVPSAPRPVTPPAATTGSAPISVPTQAGPTAAATPTRPAPKPTKRLLPSLPPLPLPTATPSQPLISVGPCGVKIGGIQLPFCGTKSP